MKLSNTIATAISQESRNEAILQNLALVNNLARRIQSRVPPCVTVDDLTSAGTIGLIEAVERFDPSRGLKLRSYAQHRILGAMLDFPRGEDPLSSSDRRRMRTSNGTESPTISLDQLPEPVMHRLAVNDGPVADTMTAASEVREARRCLTAKENRVVFLLFDLGWTGREVAAELKVHESRIAQIKHHALPKLRMKLKPRACSKAA
jgi:RNA polymerase sigma factor (sigma-70 family)